MPEPSRKSHVMPKTKKINESPEQLDQIEVLSPSEKKFSSSSHSKSEPSRRFE